MKLKIKNETKIKKNIQNKFDEFNTVFDKSENFKNEIKKCRENMGAADNELLIMENNKFTVLENVDDIIKNSDSITSRKIELTNVIDLNRNRVESLVDAGDKLPLLILLKHAITDAQNDYCVAFFDAIKKTPEFKKTEEYINDLKALYLEMHDGTSDLQLVVQKFDFEKIPSEVIKEQARTELLIK